MMAMLMAPPVAMTPAATMDLDYIGRFGIVDGGALTGKRTCSLRNRKQQCGSDADSSESFIHRQSFRVFLAADQHKRTLKSSGRPLALASRSIMNTARH